MSTSRMRALPGRFLTTKLGNGRPARRLYRWLMIASAMLALSGLGAVLAAINPAPVAKCVENESYTIELKDWTATKFKDGEHVLARLQTPRGTLESRLTIKGGVPVSDPEWFLSGKLMKEIAQSKLPATAQKCLAASSAQLLIQGAQSVIDFLVPTAYASCKSAAGKHVFKVVHVEDAAGDPVYVLEETVNGKFCRYVVV